MLSSPCVLCTVCSCVSTLTVRTSRTQRAIWANELNAYKHGVFHPATTNQSTSSRSSSVRQRCLVFVCQCTFFFHLGVDRSRPGSKISVHFNLPGFDGQQRTSRHFRRVSFLSTFVHCYVQMILHFHNAFCRLRHKRTENVLIDFLDRLELTVEYFTMILSGNVVMGLCVCL